MLLSSLIKTTSKEPIMPSLDTNRCPLCQQSNFCAVNADTPCWCTKSEVKPELLSEVPQTLLGKSCICKKCIDKFNFDNIVDKS